MSHRRGSEPLAAGGYGIWRQSPRRWAIFYVLEKNAILMPISGRVDRAPATETVGSGAIPDRVKPKAIKLVFTASLLDVQQFKNSEKPPPCVVDRWQLDSNPERPIRCLLTKVPW